MIVNNFTSAGHTYKHSSYDVAIHWTLEVPIGVAHKIINAESFFNSKIKIKDD